MRFQSVSMGTCTSPICTAANLQIQRVQVGGLVKPSPTRTVSTCTWTRRNGYSRDPPLALAATDPRAHLCRRYLYRLMNVHDALIIMKVLTRVHASQSDQGESLCVSPITRTAARACAGRRCTEVVGIAATEKRRRRTCSSMKRITAPKALFALGILGNRVMILVLPCQ
jgi:hypothetical protein